MSPTILSFRTARRRASVLLVSIVLILSASIATMSWISYVTHTQRAAIRDRDRTTAFYAAEAGVEQVVDYFNNPSNYTGSVLDGYDTEAKHPAAYSSTADVAPSMYDLFEPYIVRIARESNGAPKYDPSGKLVVTRWSYFQNELTGDPRTVSMTSKIPTGRLDISGNKHLEMTTEDGRLLARVTELMTVHPKDFAKFGGEPSPWNQRIICKVIATGTTPAGVSMRVESLLVENPNFLIASPGAILSRSSATFNGQFNVWWGELWAKSDIELPPNWDKKMPRLNPSVDFAPKNNPYPLDKWFRLRTEKHVLKPGGSDRANGKVQAGFGGSYTDAAHEETPFPMDGRWREKGKDPWVYLENVKQKQTLEFPEYDYHEWKTFVQTAGFPYYYTYTDGKLYGVEDNPSSTNYGKVVGKSYEDWLGISTSDPDYANPMKMVAFIDTVPTDSSGKVAPMVNGVPLVDDVYYPRNPELKPDGTKKDPAAVMTTIKLAGGGLHTRGAFFIAANMEMSGAGKPPAWNTIPDSIGGVVMPNYQKPPAGTDLNIFHYGLMYLYGSVEVSGNRQVYGSLQANSYTGKGTVDVFYNERLRDGSWLNLNTSRVSRRLWNVAENSKSAEPAG